MKQELIDIYESTPIVIRPEITRENAISYNFIQGAKVEITGNVPATYKVEFIDQDTGVMEYVTQIETNQWSKSTKEYFINWLINVYKDGLLLFQHRYNATNRRVLIYIDSWALGDTLAWFPMIEEFRKKHSCHVIASTYHNDLFKKEYPEIEFVKPGTEVNDIYAQYTIGFFYKERQAMYDRCPISCRTRPLQDTGSAVLGILPAEIKPKISVPTYNTNVEGKYVVIAPHASSHAKYWNNPGAWQIVVDHVVSLGYKVVMITKEKLGDSIHDSKLYGTLQNVQDKTGELPLEDRIVDIKGASLFIGLGSGLSWLSWALYVKTILISGFSYPYTEFQDCIRIGTTEPYTCTGCFNRDWLDPGDWNWCPEHKETNRQFECTKVIRPETVIAEIDKILKPN